MIRFNIFIVLIFFIMHNLQAQNDLTINYTDSSGLKQGKWLTVDTINNNIIETNFKNGIENGKYFEFNNDGKLLKEIDIKDGVKDGWGRKYGKRGNMEELHLYIKDELKHVFAFSKKGNLIKEYGVGLGNYNGEYRFYYSRNRLWVLKNYFYNTLHGNSLFYNKKGRKIYEIEYLNGEEKSKTKF